ncbi:hypothetical protein OOZ15_10385 [Galbibacter sp. EGI 63066]|uniref:PulJ/GspJ family protein n=1 Tax=Galbibacter sp. EGI 63066 TaxID=2993559 RepID=UPI002248DDA8|nr:hypothetical protein [Galbibacter sp. EGI 63066]MCX2680348.1 hypothetical protein [Galbibacter sp. EGI 63066]
MNKRAKIPAFTLNELIVAIVITLLVVGMAYSILSLVQSQMKGIEYNLNHTTETYLLKQAMTIDFNKYNTIEVNRKHTQISLKNDMDSVYYQIDPPYLLRQQDTFGLKVQAMEFYLDGSVVNGGALDAVKIVMDVKGSTREIFIHKQNDATLYMNPNGF